MANEGQATTDAGGASAAGVVSDAGQSVEAAGSEKVVPGQSGDAANQGQPAKNTAKPEQDRFAQIEKSYKELQAHATRTAQERAELRKQLDGIQASMQKFAEQQAALAEGPYDPDKFMDDLRAQGPKFLDGLWQKKESVLTKQYREEIEKAHERSDMLEAKLELSERRYNAKDYPDFAKLEKEIDEAINDAKVPLDRTLPIGELLDAAYNYVRLKHSGGAVAAAEKAGREQAEAELRREAEAGVAGGGKSAGAVVTDPSKLSLAEHRKMLVAQHGEADDI